MLTDQPFLPDGNACDPKSQASWQRSTELERSYNLQVHEILDTIAATVINAQAGLNWLRTEPPDLESARQALNSIVGDGKRAAANLTRLQALVEKMPATDGLGFLSSGG